MKRLSGMTRFFAKALFGAGFMSAASWDDAVEHLELAVAINPQYVYHRFELAEVYIDLDHYSEGRELLKALQSCRVGDVLDRVQTGSDRAAPGNPRQERQGRTLSG